jgi:DNA-cytosine methyltransferase
MNIRFIDLFAGIGGFRYGLEKVGKCKPIRTRTIGKCLQHGRDIPDCKCGGWQPRQVSTKRHRLFNGKYCCVYTNEWDKYAAQIYTKHYGECDTRDIRTVKSCEIPDFDLLVGGFPCQAFSIAGKRRGFDDTRGTLFFDIARILKEKKPRLLLLENVKGLLSHDNGRTFKTIISTLVELGYDIQWQVLNSKNFGVPQNRERVFIIGQRRDTRQIPIFPIKLPYETATEILESERVYLLPPEVSQKYGLLLSELSQSKKRFLLREQMQDLLSEIKQGISEGSCREIQGETEGLDSNPEGSLQVVEELNSWTSSQDKSREVCGVVQIPTEEVLLLWTRGEPTSISFRQIQQQDLSFECGQDRLIKGLQRREFGTLLLAVQPYQGRLLYSIGNGRDWQNIYIAEVEAKCNPTLSSILEDNPDQKYFLSEKATEGIFKQANKGNFGIKIFPEPSGKEITKVEQHSFGQTSRIHKKEGISPTIPTPSGGHHIPMICE